MSGVGAPIDDRGICWSLRSACADSRYSLLPALPSLSSSSAFSVPTIALLPAPCSSSAFGPKSYLVGSSRSGTPVATGSNLTPSGLEQCAHLCLLFLSQLRRMMDPVSQRLFGPQLTGSVR